MNDSRSILIIDDEPALRLGLAATIRREGYRVFTASFGYEGLEIARREQPDLILSDVMMPPPNGFEMRRIMSQDPQLAGIPFIFLTALTGVDDRVTGIRDGADDYVTKPFVKAELLARIEAVLRRVDMEQARGREQMQEIAQRNMEQLKHEILHNFNHELRTPLTNIVMPLEMAVTRKFHNPEEQIRFIRMALNNAERMEALVSDFLLLTSMDHGSLNRIRQPIDINAHLLGPIHRRLERYKAKELEFVQDFSIQNRILAPRAEFSHALVHLVDNACKFSPQRSCVRMALESTADGGAALTLQDEGPGVPPQLREKVFERFYQISQGDNRAHEGLGLGLTIARAVFENLGGTVSILESPSGCRIQAILPDRRPDDLVYE